MKKKHPTKDISLSMLNACFACATPEARDVMRSFAAYVGSYQVQKHTAPLFLRIIGTNDEEIIHTLLQKRHPFILFRNLHPAKELINQSIEMLTSHDPSSLCPAALYTILGLLDMVYKNPSKGMAVYRMDELELNHVAKYLNESLDQLHETNKIILRLLEYFYFFETTFNVDTKYRKTGIHAMKLRLAFLDKKHGLRSILPEQLMVQDLVNDDFFLDNRHSVQKLQYTNSTHYELQPSEEQ
ncbi:MAG: hypothetical protein D6B26_07540 [Spirochaetaceae bacterium]|nr:MAG: hypothetical protein D6B26_07540 [Spirochaetaceae bacterium]